VIAPEARFVLASGSPRRRELLAALGLRFAVLPADIDEARLPDEPALAHVQRLAREKARVVAALPAVQARALPVLAADTVVLAPAGQVLGKPRDRDDALAMLALLSGCTHRVLTAVAVIPGTGPGTGPGTSVGTGSGTPAGTPFAGPSRSGHVDAADECLEHLSDTAVTFRHIDVAEAAAYWASGEPRDKAGAYGIQGLGGIFAERIDGSFTGVMGLPVADTVALLRRVGVDVWAGPAAGIHS
jgi:septum formation protein